MKNDYRTHRAPYYGGQRFARTLQEAFGPYTNHTIHPTERRAGRLRSLFWTAVIFAGAALGVAFGVPL
jgi:hypothetical protein